jgi:hypothetical protein
VRHILPALLLCALASVMHATAAESPRTMPTRDVDVTYDINVAGRTATERMRWSVVAALLRVDPPTPGVYMIADYKRHSVALVSQAQRSVAIAPAPAATIPGAPGAVAGTGYVRGNRGDVAGMACTEWAATDTEGRSVGICMTDDGVLLRVRAQGHTLLQARTVAYGPQDAAAFVVPADYQRVRPFGG